MRFLKGLGQLIAGVVLAFFAGAVLQLIAGFLIVQDQPFWILVVMGALIYSVIRLTRAK